MAPCSLCSKDHDPLGCVKRKGCAKCGFPATHKGDKCKEPYAPYDKQLCDECLSQNHEVKNCRDFSGKVCGQCGHGDHTSTKTKKCSLVNGIPLNQLGDDIIDQFTTEYRVSALAEIQKLNASQPANPISSTRRPPSKDQSSSATLQPKSRTQPLYSPSKGVSFAAGSVKVTDEDSKAAQLTRWKLAEGGLPRSPKIEGMDPDRKTIKANFFEIKVDSTVPLWKYSITVEPAEVEELNDTKETSKTPVKEKRKIKRETKRFLINHYLTTANPPSHNNWVSDYDSIIVSVQPLYSNRSKLGIAITQPSGNGNTKKQGRPSKNSRSTLVTTVNEVGKIDMSALVKHVEGTKRMESPEDLLKVLNIVSWKNINKPNSRIGHVGNKIYPESQQGASEDSKKRQLPEQYFLRDGFFSSMRPGDKSILLNVNTVTTAFLSPINLQVWMELAWKTHRPSPKEFKLLLKDIRVTLDLHKSSRTWVICGMSPLKVGKTTFDKDGKDIAVSDYLKQEYGAAYKASPNDLEAFCINVGSQGRKIWYPANVLTILDWQIAKESVQKASGQDMVKAATRKPQVNKTLILSEGLKVLGIEPLLPFYSIFGLRPVSIMVTVMAARLDGPKLHYTKDQKGGTKPEMRKGGWNLIEQPGFLEPRVAKRMLVMPLTQSEFMERDHGPKPLKPAVILLGADLKRYGMTKQEGFKIIPAPFETMPGLIKDSPNRPGDRKKWTEKFDEKFSSFKSIEDGDFLLVILPSRDITMYQEVKRWADCMIGIPSTCVTAEKLSRSEHDPAIRANICLKVNFKLKGVSHRIDAGIKGRQATGAKFGTMIVGADVTHPGKALNDCPSMAAIVATNDECSGHYLGSARLQKCRQEYISDLEGMIEERVLAWFNNSNLDANGKTNAPVNRLPKCILFYRDGVSESQYGMVLDEEKEQIMRGCRKALVFLQKPANGNASLLKGVTWTPKLTLVVVTKRHHARFYPMLEAPDINLPMGTMVDNKIVTPFNWSFYLQSHHSELGTARSALYVVLFDDCNYTAYELQKITNNICYTSARATKVVSVCTPARYADILCDRLRCYMKPVLEATYDVETSKPGTSKKSSPASSPAKSLRNTVLAKAAKGDKNEERNPRYVEDYEADANVWMPMPRTDGRKNPWHERLDDRMFYL